MKFSVPVAVLVLCGAVLLMPAHGFAQEDDQAGQRKVVNKVAPSYPSLARRFNARGSVRLEAVVGSDGTVKSLSVKGGHPLLVEAAESAIRKWKYAPAKSETTESIEVIFNPDN